MPAPGEAGFVTDLVRDLLYAKLRNSKEVLLRAARGGVSQSDAVQLKKGAEQLSALALQLADCADVDSMRGVEGAAASAYFACFDCMLRTEAHGFALGVRSRRPPKNEVNAALSFATHSSPARRAPRWRAWGSTPRSAICTRCGPGAPPSRST